MNKRVLLKELKSLDLEQRANQVLQKRYYSHQIDLARKYQDWIELHATGSKDGRGYELFVKYYQELLPEDKHVRFEQLLGEKMPTAHVCDTVYTELKKVFSAQNKRINYGLSTPEQLKDVLKDTTLNPTHFIENDLWERIKYAPNDVLIIKTDDDGEPYHEFIDLYNVCDLCSNEDGTVNYVLYSLTKKTYKDKDTSKQVTEEYFIYLDWEGYVKIKRTTNQGEEPLTITEESAPHNIGYCPAILTFPKINSPKINSVTTASPLLKVINRLNWLAFFIPSKQFLNSYASFPIITKFEEREDFEEENGNEARDGFVVEDSLEYMRTDHAQFTQKKKKSIVGAGTVLEIPTPDNETLPNILEAVKFINADYRNLEFVDKQEYQLIEQLFYSVVGRGAEMITRFSASADQLENAYDSRKNVLAELRIVLERIHKFYADTVLSIKYGNSYDPDATSIFYGDTYYLMTPQQVADQYDKYVKSGVPESLKLDQLNTLIYTTYSNSPKQLYRAKVLLNVEPYPTYTLNNFITLAQSGIISDEIIYKKLQFNDLIEEYELNFGDIGNEYNTSTIVTMVNRVNEFLTSKFEQSNFTFTTEQPDNEQTNQSNNQTE